MNTEIMLSIILGIQLGELFGFISSAVLILRGMKND